MKGNRAVTFEQLKAAGELLVGPEWQRAFARMLGPFHPDGHRDTIDDRLVRRWATGERPIPPWVDVVIEMRLESRAQHFEAAARKARRLSDVLTDQLKYRHDDEYVRYVQDIMAREAKS